MTLSFTVEKPLALSESLFAADGLSLKLAGARFGPRFHFIAWAWTAGGPGQVGNWDKNIGSMFVALAGRQDSQFAVTWREVISQKDSSPAAYPDDSEIAKDILQVAVRWVEAVCKEMGYSIHPSISYDPSSMVIAAFVTIIGTDASKLRDVVREQLRKQAPFSRGRGVHGRRLMVEVIFTTLKSGGFVYRKGMREAVNSALFTQAPGRMPLLSADYITDVALRAITSVERQTK